MNDAMLSWMAAPDQHVQHWEPIQDLVDHTIDLLLNYRQSGHPGGSRSKTPALVALTLSGAMRFDITAPHRPLADRFILGAGHCVPAVYALLAVFNEALRIRHESTGDQRFSFPLGPRHTLTWEDLTGFRHRGGLPGHAEMAGKTLFLKFNTGPSGHGTAAALGQAVALKRAGAGGIRVFVMEGDGGLTPGVTHEVRNAAWAYGLDNLVFLVDWNNFGIDPHPISDVVPGTPESWFESYDWRVRGVVDGEDKRELSQHLLALVSELDPGQRPAALWFRTRKGRGYNKFDAASHGAPHSPMNAPEFWATVEPFCNRYGIEFEGFGQPAPAQREQRTQQAAENFRRLFSLLRTRMDVTTYLSDRLLELAATVPSTQPALRVGLPGPNPWKDSRFFQHEDYPESLWLKPGENAPNRQALGRWGALVNSMARSAYGRPLFLAVSADLAHSTNVAGFAGEYEGLPGFGAYHRDHNPDGALLPGAITEFANAGLAVGAASTNLSQDPFAQWDGFATVCSTYGSFSYLKYGMMRLFSQLAQDSEIKVGKVLWVVGHSGPETAEDSRTHFGIFSPTVTQLFPRGRIINLHPWDYNEVPVLLAEAMKTEVPIVAIHLTRPPMPVPDREALGIPPFSAAARGAYILRDYRPNEPRGGVVFVQGTVTTHQVLSLLPTLNSRGLNVKIIAAVSAELFRRQPAAYRTRVLSWDEFMDSTFITNGARIAMQDWTANRLSLEYALSADWDDQWRTGGSVEEVYQEAHLDPEHLLKGLARFVAHRPQRLKRLVVEP